MRIHLITATYTQTIFSTNSQNTHKTSKVGDAVSCLIYYMLSAIICIIYYIIFTVKLYMFFAMKVLLLLHFCAIKVHI